MKATFNWQDPFMLSEQLSEDERAIVDAAHQFGQLAPEAGDRPRQLGEEVAL